MQIGNQLEFCCIACGNPVCFSILDSQALSAPISCPSCGKQYLFDDETILRHLKLFEALCHQIHESREILGNTHVAVTVGDQEVKIPYKILLSRLNSTINLQIDDQELQVTFRTEPTKDLLGKT